MKCSYFWGELFEQSPSGFWYRLMPNNILIDIFLILFVSPGQEQFPFVSLHVVMIFWGWESLMVWTWTALWPQMASVPP